MSSLIMTPFENFLDVDGNPLEDGYVYVGSKGLNPETSPVTVYWDQELTIPASQPIRTLGGFLSRSGTPANIYINADNYSITVRNKNLTLVHTNLNAGRVIKTLSFSNYTDLRNLNTLNLSNGLPITVTDQGVGGPGVLRNVPTHGLTDNGATIIVVDANWYWERLDTGALDVKWFGAVGDGVTDDTLAIQNALNEAIVLSRAVYLSEGRYRTTAQLTITQNPAPGGAYGVTFYGDTSTWSGVSTIYAEHTDPAILNLKGSNGSRISGIKFESDLTTFPKCAIILGRDVNVDSCGWHNIQRIWIDGNYSAAPVYSIASEENLWSDIFIQLRGGGAIYGFYSSTGDILAVDSLPSSSNIANSITKMNIWNWVNDPNAACVYLECGEAMGSWSFYDCYCIPKSGRYYKLNMGLLTATPPLGPFTFINCGGEIYDPVSPWLDSPLYAYEINSASNMDLKGLTILNPRCQLINAASSRKILQVSSNLGLVKPNIVIPALEDPAVSYSVFRSKVKSGVFDVSDSSAWVPLTFLNTWANTFGAPYAPAAFQVDNTGTLRLRGNVTNAGAGVSNLAQLPPGYEPQYNMFFATQDNGVNAKILIFTTGIVALTVGTGTDVELSDIAFKLSDH